MGTPARSGVGRFRRGSPRRQRRAEIAPGSLEARQGDPQAEGGEPPASARGSLLGQPVKKSPLDARGV
jgi:hypothetical protein